MKLLQDLDSDMDVFIQKMKLDPDIVTLGKIVGGGFPIGVICGKDEIMQHANTSINSKKVEHTLEAAHFLQIHYQ